MQTLEKTRIVKNQTDTNHPLTVCFVCTGNTCRSPMAQALVNDSMRPREICSACDIERLLNRRQVRAISAGIFATGAPISENAVRALEKAGVFSMEGNDYRSHLSRTIDEEILNASDLVVCMTSLHAMRLLSEFPAYASKITCMPNDIPDPYGGDEAAYDACLSEIKKGIEQMRLMESGV